MAMKHTGSIIFYQLNECVEELKTFNAVHVIRFWGEWDYSSTRSYRRSLIDTFPISNFFRKLFGKASKKPRRPKRFFYMPAIRIEFSNDSRAKHYRYKSKAAMNRDLDRLSHFMSEYYPSSRNKITSSTQ